MGPDEKDKYRYQRKAEFSDMLRQVLSGGDGIFVRHDSDTHSSINVIPVLTSTGHSSPEQVQIESLRDDLGKAAMRLSAQRLEITELKEQIKDLWDAISD